MFSLFKVIVVAVWITAPARARLAEPQSELSSFAEPEPYTLGTVEPAFLNTSSCKYNTYMCCWTENDNGGMEDNTDVCNVVLYGGNLVDYPGDSEGDVHCHGLVWNDGAHYDSFIWPLYQYVKHFDHMASRGYSGSLPGAPQCGCIEDMPMVSRADCTTYSSQGLVACEENDLRTHYDDEMGQPGGDLTENLVGACGTQQSASSVEPHQALGSSMLYDRDETSNPDDVRNSNEFFTP